MRLFLVELTRFRSRRAIVLMVLAAAVLTGFMAGATIWETRPITEKDMAAAQAMADREAERPYIQREIARCERNPERYLGKNGTAGECVEQMAPKAEWFLYRQEISLNQAKDDVGLAALLLVAAVMVIVGTTFAGGDWASGSVSNQLLFNPQRLRVWGAKAAAVAVGTALATAVIVSGFWLALYVTAELRGIPTGATVQESIRAMVGRGVLMAAAGAVGAYALTMLLRHTVGTLAVLFAYSVGGAALIAALPIDGSGRWNVANNVLAWVQNGMKYYDPSLPCGPRGCDQMVFLSFASGATYLGVLLAVAVVLSVISFRRRDVP